MWEGTFPFEQPPFILLQEQSWRTRLEHGPAGNFTKKFDLFVKGVSRDESARSAISHSARKLFKTENDFERWIAISASLTKQEIQNEPVFGVAYLCLLDRIGLH